MTPLNMDITRGLAILVLTLCLSGLRLPLVAAQGEIDGGADHPCYRECDGVTTMECVYNFTVQSYYAMGTLCGDCPNTPEDCFNTGCVAAGGIQRPVTTINRRIPGPSIQVCQFDTIIVNVKNAMEEESLVIHWHGLHQRDTQFMDGVPYVTQCPILPHDTFQYRFSASHAGSHIYHSHIGVQEADGVYGAMIVRRPKADEPSGDLYDYDLAEHHMLLWHFFNTNTRDVLTASTFAGGSLEGNGYLVNGIGNFQDSLDGATAQMPKQVFTVESGYRYRIRNMLNTGLYCPAQVSIDGHRLLMIASEASSFEPVEVDSFFINAGERYDYILTADQPVGNYWIRIRGVGGFCEGPEVLAEAVLRYSGAEEVLPYGTPTYEEANRYGVIFNPVGAYSPSYNATETILVADLINIDTEYDYDINAPADTIFYLGSAVRFLSEDGQSTVFPQVNNITFSYPPVPLLTQGQQLSDSDFCAADLAESTECYDSVCRCTHVISASLNDIVEVVLVDTSGATDHPFHIHGCHFHVVAMDTIGADNSLDLVREMNENGLIEKNLVNAALKDTISVPGQGYVIFRFVADNPGFWIFHCHLTNHAHEGMVLVMKVGEFEEFGAFPEDFPTCGDWQLP